MTDQQLQPQSDEPAGNQECKGRLASQIWSQNIPGHVVFLFSSSSGFGSKHHNMPTFHLSQCFNDICLIFM